MSRLIKSSHYIALDDLKLIEVIQQTPNVDMKGFSQPDNSLFAEQQIEISQANILKEQILRDAEQAAEEQIRAAMEEAAFLKEQTSQEIERWWDDRRSQDEQAVAEARSAGYAQGYQEGLENAEADIRTQYAFMIEEAGQVLLQAYAARDEIIQGAEPFLVDLSCSIAGKIVHQQLTISRDLVLEMIKKALSRKKQKGTVVLCVAPEQFSFVQDAYKELALVVDSQAELQILPDSGIKDHGCVIRTSFGSIDARVETQLSEIKTALLKIAEQSGDLLHED
ncbi:FliH/SctL family protein [Paenibacillaceae bacterium T2]|uniref:FliH/SctL family protein n=1 Tax=Ferviditalea candida TaxID=3108399 RepID=A0ABU5ZF79_9BACL|nr:FliH/SctL family protein [Paenibacillaceae bacterium T2]